MKIVVNEKYVDKNTINIFKEKRMLNKLNFFKIQAIVLVLGVLVIGCKIDTNDDINTDNPYNNNDPKIITVGGLPYGGDWIIMLSTGTNLDKEAFDKGIIAIGFATTRMFTNEASFSLKKGNFESGPSSTNYTGTGDFYLALYHKNSSTWLDSVYSPIYGDKPIKIKIESSITISSYNIWEFRSTTLDWNPEWWPFV